MMISLTLVAMTTYPAFCASDELVPRVAANLADVRARIVRAGRVLEGVRIVAVTKTFAPAMVRAASAAGLTNVAENYVDELIEKRAATADLDLRWFFLGALQTNKIHRVLAAADVLCAVSRVKEIEKIAKERTDVTIYVQVDCTGATTRNGAAPHEVADLVGRARERGLDVRGLMTVAPPDVRGAREAFHITSDLADGLAVVERSMGMSDDLELACELGTTEVRVGRALFGARTDQ
jgi:pyridoxal phosphate enzyme (YggS family)